MYLGTPILISAIVKLILITVLYSSPINKDGILYITAARQFAMGNFAEGLALFPMPVYPLLIAFIHMVIPNLIFAGYFISIISMILATIPLYYLTKTMFNMRVAFWACIIFAVLPEMNEWSMYISRDSLFLVLFLWCIYFAIRSITETNFFLFGATFILAWTATLIRIEGVLFLGLFIFVLFYLGIADKKNRSCYFFRLLIWIAIPLSVGLIAMLLNGINGIAVNRFDQVCAEVMIMFKGSFLTKPFEIYKFLSEVAGQQPFSDMHYSFLELCRRFLPLIYMFGIIQILIKILFPLSLVPLYLGMKDLIKPSGNSGKFIFWIWLLFIGLGYYYLIKKDFLITRWGMVPATLLLPWLGLGMDRLWKKVKISSYKGTILCLLFIILLAPTVKTLSMTSKKDITTNSAVKWLIDNDKINRVQIVANNLKDSFYIDLESQAQMDSKWVTQYYNKRIASESIEDFALENHAEIIVFKIKAKNIEKIDNFDFYQMVKSFVGIRYITFVYMRKAVSP